MDWHKLIERVVESGCQYYLLIYEDLLRDPVNEMRKVINFLQSKIGFKLDNLEERLLCLSENMQGNNKRKKNNIRIDPFTQKLKIIVNSKIAQAEAVLSKAGIHINFNNYQRSIN